MNAVFSGSKRLACAVVTGVGGWLAAMPKRAACRFGVKVEAPSPAEPSHQGRAMVRGVVLRDQPGRRLAVRTRSAARYCPSAGDRLRGLSAEPVKALRWSQTRQSADHQKWPPPAITRPLARLSGRRDRCAALRCVDQVSGQYYQARLQRRPISRLRAAGLMTRSRATAPVDAPPRQRRPLSIISTGVAPANQDKPKCPTPRP
jgi:hypothetical protein